MDGTRAGNAVRPFDPSTDTSILKEAIEQIGNVRLIVIDPVSTAVAGDSHKNTEVRRGLQPLVDLVTTINAALLGITHPCASPLRSSSPARRAARPPPWGLPQPERHCLWVLLQVWWLVTHEIRWLTT